MTIEVDTGAIDYFSSQSAALQKKLHHLEVQLKNEKQSKDDLDHKYRCSSCYVCKTLEQWKKFSSDQKSLIFIFQSCNYSSGKTL